MTEIAFAGLTASTHPATASATLSFDFIVKPLSTNHRSRHQHGSLVKFFTSMALSSNSSQSAFFGQTMQLNRRQAGAAINSGRHDGSGGTDARH
jgi:hypothetical protein